MKTSGSENNESTNGEDNDRSTTEGLETVNSLKSVDAQESE